MAHDCESCRSMCDCGGDWDECDDCSACAELREERATIKVNFRGTRVPLGKHPHEFMSEGEEFEAADIRGCYAQAERRAEDLARIFGVPVRAFEAGDRTAFYTTTSEEEAS